LQLGHEQLERPALEQAFETGGEAGAIMRALDWSRTLLGPIASWPQSLCDAVSLVLGCGIPMDLSWGPDLVQLYNDAALPVMGQKHPMAIGRPLREVWPELVDTLVPYGNLIMATGRPVIFEKGKLLLNRRGRLEAGYFRFSFSPVRDERGAVAGVLDTFIEITDRVLSERRLRTLRELAARTVESRSPWGVCTAAVAAMALNRSDIPFALVYLGADDGKSASLAGVVGGELAEAVAPRTIELGEGDASPWPLGRVARTNTPEVVTDLLRRHGALVETGRAAPKEALVLPAMQTGEAHARAFLVAGLNPYRPLDDAYTSYLQLVAASIGAAIAKARADEDARRRAEELAELDRAKTTFISNMSHEFRTPITLVLGPVEELLADAKEPLTPGQREELSSVRRAALRLLRLVNDLLAFARIEAGRLEALFSPVDLARLTRELVAMFDSAAARAGLRLVVDCPALSEPIYVDRELWEKIVMNLLANAIKFTLEGKIEVRLRLVGERVQLVVSDTGLGIPKEELPHLFERFHRIRQPRARSEEGTGIGLSLVRELVRMHGGEIRVESVVGKGSTFTIEIPRGSAHLPQDRVGERQPEVPRRERAFFAEGARRIIVDQARQPQPSPIAGKRARPLVLVAEDNTDMREYLERILARRYDVVSAVDGVAALETVRARWPDLVVSDILMPRLDGLALVSALREDPDSRSLPIVLLSARAGEEATLEGLSRGADDYVVKPFSSRELLARIDTHLELARVRRELGEQKLKDEFVMIASHELWTPLTILKLDLQLARRRLEKAGAPHATLLAHVDGALVRMETLIGDLLTTSGIERGDLPFRTEPCDLVEVCRLATEQQAAAMEREVALDLPERRVEAVIDRHGIEHVVSILLSNALKFSPPDRPVTLSLRSTEAEATVSVRDEGPGIPAEELPRMFRRFHRVPGIAVQAGSMVGLGLGLYICKAIVERHGGHVHVESDIGKGSTFSVSLPLRPPPSPRSRNGNGGR
jgi:signal transduction histidine kinase